ncbi:MAG: PAS domain-containing protein [Campylobacterales bacterium]|nr:PAS domain-containing protein [Campylobacterales bacterium]
MRGNELTFNEHEFIVSKTNMSGKITYGNSRFIAISGYKETELLDQPHNILRHPDMPSTIFKYLWDQIKKKEEVFAYVINKTKQNDFYWVMAHVTPSIDNNGSIIGYHSVRRKPTLTALSIIKPLYQSIVAAEKRGGVTEGNAVLMTKLHSMKVTYDEFILSL